MRHLLPATIKDNAPIWDSVAERVKVIGAFEGERVVFEIKKEGRLSYQQIKYYWGGVVDAFYEEYLIRGIEKVPVMVRVNGEWKSIEKKTTPERVHEILKTLHLPEGKTSITELDPKEMSEYIEDIRRDAEQQGFYIMTSEEYLRSMA